MSDEPDEPCDGRIERRTVLKSTGAAALAGVTAGTGTASAERAPPVDHVGSTTVVEVAVEHPGLSAGPTNHATPLPFSSVDARTGQFRLQLGSDAAKATLRESDGVVFNRGYHALPATLYDGETVSELVAATNPRLRPTATVSVAERYSPPTIRVEEAGDAVAVTADGRTVEVAPGSRTRLVADERTARVERPGGIATASVSPTVTVQHYGQLDAFVVQGGGE